MGPMLVTQALLGLMHQPGGKVVFLSSRMASLDMNHAMAGVTAGGALSYRCSKAAMNMMCRTFASEWPDIQFMCVSPGHVQTDMGTLDGRQPPQTVEESVAGMLGAVDALPADESGAFVNFDGRRIMW